jgi:hypothetical protein
MPWHVLRLQASPPPLVFKRRKLKNEEITQILIVLKVLFEIL